MNFETLSGKFNTAAKTAGIVTYLFAPLFEFNFNREENKYPVLIFEPPDFILKTRANPIEWVSYEFRVIILKNWSRDNDTDTREQIWDDINTLAIAFFQTLNSDEHFDILEPDNINAELKFEGSDVEQDLAIIYTFDMKVYC